MIKIIVKKVIPKFVLNYILKILNNKQRRQFVKMSQYEIFKKIYLNKLWSPESEKLNHKFYSGIGSYHPELTNLYIEKIKLFLLSLSKKPDVVDLGCGDFIIGSKVRKYCNNYIAIDVFDELINYNIKKYEELNVDFRVLNITSAELPAGDVCFIRQVLQHLSNQSILNFIKALKNKYKYLIITEHYPSSKNFKHNLDKPTGPDVRIIENSAVVLTSPPFNLKVLKEIDAFQTSSSCIKGILQTRILQLKD